MCGLDFKILETRSFGIFLTNYVVFLLESLLIWLARVMRFTSSMLSFIKLSTSYTGSARRRPSIISSSISVNRCNIWLVQVLPFCKFFLADKIYGVFSIGTKFSKTPPAVAPPTWLSFVLFAQQTKSKILYIYLFN